MSIFDDPDAVAALGVWREYEDNADAEPAADVDWAQDIHRAVARGSVNLSLDLARLGDSQLSDQVIADLSTAWQTATTDYRNGHPDYPLRLQAEAEEPAQATALAELLGQASGVGSFTIVDRNLAGPARWDLPLSIGAFGAGVRHAVESYHHNKLIEFDFADDTRHEFDLLILESLDEIADLHDRNLAAGFLVVLADDPEDVNVENVHRLNGIIGFRAAAIVSKQDNLHDQIYLFLDNLAHDLTPDVAITNAIYHDSRRLVVGDPQFLDRARFSAVTGRLEEAVELQFHTGAIAAEEFAAMGEELAAAPVANPGAWSAEGGAATETVHRTGAVRETMRDTAGTRATAVEPPQRHLQAQVFDVSGNEPVQRTRSFAVDAAHEIRVRVGPSSMNWISAPQPFPDRELPPEETRLTVHLLAPGFIDAPAAREITIGPAGSSSVAKFTGQVPPDATQIDATIIVYHNGRHLQTAVLSGPVTQGEDTPLATGIDFTRGLPSQADIGRQPAFDLSIWKDGAELELTLFDPNAAPGAPSNIILQPSLGGIDAVVDSISAILFDAASRIEQLETGIENAGLPTLRKLAEHGEFIRRKLFREVALDRILRVQAVSPHSSDFFPVEFLYDYVLPDEDAELCPEFKHGSGPDCTPDCRAADGDSGYICPSGFWALNRIIERQVRPAARDNGYQTEATTRSSNRIRLGEIIFAASDNVNTPDHPDAIQQTIADMQANAPVYPARTWREWTDHVRAHYPALLVALPHNVESSPFHKLQIAAAEELALNRIGSEHVVPAGADTGPAVLLLGCNTANADVAYQDFVNEIRCAGAALVIATLTYALGPQAASVAREFVTQIWHSSGTATAGEIMRQVRGRMLAQDNIMALAITAFGDADWHFH